VTVPLNVHWKENELRDCVKRCGIRSVITHSSLLSHWGKTFSQEKGIAFVLIDRISSHESAVLSVHLRRRRSVLLQGLAPGTEVLRLCTSGSTGRPKIISKTHAHLLAGVKNLAKALAVTRRDRFLAVVPFSHANGFENCMLLPMLFGASVVLMRQFSPRSMLELLEKERVTILIGSPFIFSALSDMADRDYDFSSIRFCLSAGAPLPHSVKKAFFDRFDLAIRGHYGASEAGPLSVQLGEYHEDDGSVGRPFDKVKVKIVGDAGEELLADETGEILVRSNSQVRRYWREPKLTAKAFTRGYFRTGDLGMLDRDGKLHIVGRNKLIINAAGNKIDPVEVRNVLMQFSKVKDAFVTGMTNRRGLEIVKAVVVAQDDCTVNEIVNFCKKHLAYYKIPRVIEFQDKIPTDIMGKVIWSSLP